MSTMGRENNRLVPEDKINAQNVECWNFLTSNSLPDIGLLGSWGINVPYECQISQISNEIIQ